MAKPMQVGYGEIGRLFWLPPARQHGETEREIAADCRRRPSEISRGLPVTESQGRCGIPTSSCLLVLLCRTATHSSCRDPRYRGHLLNPRLLMPYKANEPRRHKIPKA